MSKREIEKHERGESMKTKQVAGIAFGMQVVKMATGLLAFSVLAGCGRSDDMAREVARETAEDRKREATLQTDVAASEAKSAREDAQRLKQAEEKEKAEDAQLQEGDEKDAKAALKQFEFVNLNPQITISEKLKKFAAVADLRGEQIRELQRLHGQKDWIGLIKALGITYDPDEWLSKSLPKEPTINRAFSDLDSKEYFITLKTGTPIPMEEICYQKDNLQLHHALYLIAMKKPFHPNDAPFEWDAYDWKEHPDSGFMHKWNIRTDELFLLLGETPVYATQPGTMEDTLCGMRKAYEDAAVKLDEKKKLGDIDESQWAKSLADLRATLRNQIAALLAKY
jgi:hypothetical protein